MAERKIRVLIGKLGLDGHDVGARVVARGLVDAGMEVIYTGLRRTPDQVARAALQEDADVVGVSILSGAHLVLLPRLRQCMDAHGLYDTLLIAGGIVPDEDVQPLREAGVAAVFHPGSAVAQIAEFIRTRTQARTETESV